MKKLLLALTLVGLTSTAIIQAAEYEVQFTVEVQCYNVTSNVAYYCYSQHPGLLTNWSVGPSNSVIKSIDIYQPGECAFTYGISPDGCGGEFGNQTFGEQRDIFQCYLFYSPSVGCEWDDKYEPPVWTCPLVNDEDYFDWP